MLCAPAHLFLLDFVTLIAPGEKYKLRSISLCNIRFISLQGCFEVLAAFIIRAYQFTEFSGVLLTASIVRVHRHDYGGSKRLWNVSQFLRDCSAQHPTKQSSSCFPLWEPEIFLILPSQSLKYSPQQSVFKHLQSHCERSSFTFIKTKGKIIG
jgi:hypothetical protein